MDVTIAMGHFCENHGPCVVMCTDRAQKIPEEPPPSLSVPICGACESIELDTVYACQDDKCYYISTRTSLDPNMASRLKNAILRSLSVELVIEDGNDDGTMYFGDDKRGHIITHVFNIKDSLARGFKRKYCIVVLGKYKVPLLHHYEFIEKNLKQISTELQEKANKINESEQAHCSQREARQTQGAKSKPILRSLKTLVGERFVFAHLHLWFVFLLRAEIYKTIPHKVPECPVECPTPKELRELAMDMPQHIFRTISYCMLIGIKLEEENVEVIKHFRQLIPKDFILPTSGETCKISKNSEGWNIQFKRTLPKSLPRLYLLIEEALFNKNLPDDALGFHIMSLTMKWFSIACVISWAPTPCQKLMQALEVRKCDMPLLSYWVPQSNSCVKLNETDWFKENCFEEMGDE